MQVNWIPIVERKNSLLFQDFLVKGSSREYFKKAIGVDYAYGTNKYVDGRTSMAAEDLNRSSAVMAREIEKDDEYYEQFADMCYRQAERLIRTSERIGGTPGLKRKTIAELRSLFTEYAEQVLRMEPFLIMANVVEFMFQDRLAAMLKKETGITDEDEIQWYLRKLVIPSRESLVAEEVRDMLRIGALIQENPKIEKILQLGESEALERLPDNAPSIWEEIAEHVDRFAWMNTIGYLGDPMTCRDVLERLRYLIRRNCGETLEARKRQDREARDEFERIAAELDLSQEFINLAEVAGEYIYLRIFRMDALLIAHHNVRPLLDDIARRMEREPKDILFMRYDEIVGFLNGGPVPSPKEIAQRRDGYALVMVNREANLYVGEELASLKEQEPEAKRDYSGTRILPGTPASLGQATGPARLVLEPKDMSRVNEGDVLVAVMTTPDLILAMERSGAIVTDEGGMLCHAAIVSRELGIPCVIGTQIATRAIKEGDKVRVDAGELEGRVKILERYLT